MDLIDNYLLEVLFSDENLKRAKQQVKKNKGACGIDGMEIKEQIRNKKYKPKPVTRVEIPKPDGGVRNLRVSTVLDRFV